MEFSQISFLEGLNQQVEPTRSSRNQYYYLENARVRKDAIIPVQQHEEITSQLPPYTKLQGIYGGRNFLLVFADGKAYYKILTNEDAGFSMVRDFQMDANVDRLYAEFVPSSTFNFQRILQTVVIDNETRALGNNIQTLLQNFSSTPSGILVQDKINQPWIILENFEARRTGNYEDWTIQNREYVPIGGQMLWTGRKLYIISVDGSEIFQGISGRPLDFMIVIQQDGNKLPYDDGNASKVSYKASFNRMTAINKLPIQEAFFGSTRSESFFIFENEEKLQFGEPTLEKVDLFGTGPLNELCLLDVAGDTAFIDEFGIRSFNARKAIDSESNEVGFSALVQDFFENNTKPVIQQNPCCVEFNFYGLFAVNTKHGYGIMVYDKQLETFVSFDPHPAQIRQFAYALGNEGRQLFFMDGEQKLYRAYSPDTAHAIVRGFIGEFSSNDPKVELKPNNTRFVLNNVSQTGKFDVSLYVDRQLVKRLSETVQANVGTASNEATAEPFGGDSSKDKVRNLMFNFALASKIGWKVGLFFECSAKAELTHISLSCEEVIPDVTVEQTKKHFTRYLKFPDNIPANSSSTTQPPNRGGDTIVITGPPKPPGPDPEPPEEIRTLYFDLPRNTATTPYGDGIERTVVFSSTHRTAYFAGKALGINYTRIHATLIKFTSGVSLCGETEGCLGGPDTYETIWEADIPFEIIGTGVHNLGGPDTRWSIPVNSFTLPDSSEKDISYFLFVEAFTGTVRKAKDVLHLYKKRIRNVIIIPPDNCSQYNQPFSYFSFDDSATFQTTRKYFDLVVPTRFFAEASGETPVIPTAGKNGSGIRTTTPGSTVVTGSPYSPEYSALRLHNATPAVPNPCGFSARVWGRASVFGQGAYGFIFHNSWGMHKVSDASHPNELTKLLFTLQNNTSLETNDVFDMSGAAYHHIVVVFDAKLLKMFIYINGQPQGEKSAVINFTLVGGLMYLGSPGGFSGLGSGAIDEICFWKNRALTAQDVLNDYNNGAGKFHPLS